jgi:predicted negative regulator of RcsB-dependent stress response
LLDVAEAGSFAPMYHDVRGDVFAAKGDSAAAAREYDAVLAANDASEAGVDRAYVELKRDALPAAATAPATIPGTGAAPVKPQS